MYFYMDVPPLLPKPQGKPAAMKEMAEACRLASKDLFGSCQSVSGSVRSMTFVAPVASRIRGTVDGNTHTVVGIAEDLESFASQLETGAEKLQDRIDKYEKRKKDHDAAIANNEAYEIQKKVAEIKAAAKQGSNPMAPTGPLFR